MNDRKQHVINKAHQLFIEKGYQATSILDIIDFSGISKGTFYNYFSSKNELLIAIFTSLSKKIDEERNALLIGHDPADIEIFIQQIELQMAFNHRNKLLTLFEEVFVSNDPALKQFLKQTQILHIRWTYNRLLDLFGEQKQPYLLDCAIMFVGMLHHNIHFHFLANESNGNIRIVIRYTVQRLIKMVEEIGEAGDRLLDPAILEKWLPDCHYSEYAFKKQLYTCVLALKNRLNDDEDQLKYVELLDFILEEMLHSKKPRKFLVKTTIDSLKNHIGDIASKDLEKLDRIIDHYFDKKESVSQPIH
ncbi:TetR/AcrR family transcriptional regulator [Bacillus sp. JJ1764]|uniref:TetR/AcrR family transcriptional regulator n=1 Tax=Bacillus sp. JJ1764 TaxID=3122964 RepID=UPI002FFEE7DB